MESAKRKRKLDQTQSDAVLDDVSCMVGYPGPSSKVVGSWGVVVGRITFCENGDIIDCTKRGTGGKLVPSNIEGVGEMSSDAEFILLVEKDDTFMELAADRFYNRFPCIIVTPNGQCDVATRLFLTKMKMELKLPVLALVDSDPHGLKILSFYSCGWSYDIANLITLDIKWLGIRPSDLKKYKIPKECRLPMTTRDIKTATNMLKDDFVKKNRGWAKEVNLMVKSGKKVEIEALCALGMQYFSKVFLPSKLEQEGFVPLSHSDTNPIQDPVKKGSTLLIQNPGPSHVETAVSGRELSG